VSPGRPAAAAVPEGVSPAVPTPFGTGGAVDLPAFRDLCARLVEAGSRSLVVGGTTGEAPTLRAEEQVRLVREAAAAAGGRVPVVAGAVSNATAKAADLVRGLCDAGADAILCVVPYYNRPGQAGVLAHFTAVADASDRPLVVHDVPSRTACALADETVVALSRHPRVRGLADATGDVRRPARLRRLLDPGFVLLSADDRTAPDFAAHGGDGWVSVLAAVVPGLCRRAFDACRSGRWDLARPLLAEAGPLIDALSAEADPAPVKHVLHRLGVMAPHVRLSLVGLAPGSARACDRALDALLAARPADVLGGPGAGSGGAAAGDPTVVSLAPGARDVR